MRRRREFIVPPGNRNARLGGMIRAGGGLSYTVSISGLTSNPTYGATAQIGVELTASASGWTGDAPSSVAWQWYDGSGAISGATSATYTPVSGDDLEAIYATATPSDTYDPKNSAAYLVRYAPAVNTVAPVASGSTSLGDTLSATNGTWTGATGGSYSHQWQRDGVDISGATAASHTIVAADDAADLRCVVTYTNSGGAVSANSNAVTVDDFAAPAITGSPTISGTEQVGQTLTATAASVTGNPTPSRAWQWVNSASGDISGATSSTYTLQASDEGDTISVRQTETNGIGSDTATSAATGAIAAAPEEATLSNLDTATDAGVSFEVETDIGTAVYWLVDQNATRTYAQTAAGGGQDSGNEFIPAGVNTIFYDMTGALGGTWYVHVVKSGGGDGDVLSSSFTYQSAPAAMTVGQWTATQGSSASEIDFDITTLPSNGGSAITALQYSTDNGATWANLTGTGTGSRTISTHSDGVTGTLTAGASYTTKVRAVNAIGNGADSDAKSVNAGASATPFGVTWVAKFGDDAASDPSPAIPFTSGSISIGDADVDRVVIFVAHVVPNGSASVTGVEIDIGSGYTSMSQLGSNVGVTNAETSVWYLAVPSGTTATFRITMDGSYLDMAGATFRAIRPSFGTPVTANPVATTTCNLNLNVADGDFVLAAATTANGDPNTWTGVTWVYDSDIRTDDHMTAGIAGPVSAATPRTVNVVSTLTSNNIAGFAVAISEAA